MDSTQTSEVLDRKPSNIYETDWIIDSSIYVQFKDGI